MLTLVNRLRYDANGQERVFWNEYVCEQRP